MPRQSSTSPQRVQGALRRAEALRLRAAGLTYQEIADEMGISKPKAYRHVSRALEEVKQEVFDEAASLRALELARLDAMQRAISAQVADGNLAAIDRALKIMEQRAKLLGLNAPQRTEHTGADSSPQHWVVVFDDGSGGGEGATG